jgi:stringent starvation protein B
MAIYANENGQGMVFESDDQSGPPDPPHESGTVKKESNSGQQAKKPALKIVK